MFCVDGPKPSYSEVSLVAVLVAAFAFLFYVEDPLLLSSAFLVFLAINVAGWVYLRRLAGPFSRAAAKSYLASRDRVGEIKVMLYDEYMFGRWQWWRFGVGFALLVVLAVTSFGFVPLPRELDGMSRSRFSRCWRWRCSRSGSGTSASSSRFSGKGSSG